MRFVCPDTNVFRELWDNHILDILVHCHDKAIDHAKFIIRTQRKGTPYTLNHYFNENLHKSQNTRLVKLVQNAGITAINNAAIRRKKGFRDDDEHPEDGIFISTERLQRLQSLSVSKLNSDQTMEQVHDVLKSYYKVARKRVADVVCQQVVGYMLLDSQDGPLHVFSSKFVRGLSDENLEDNAGEDVAMKSQRPKLGAKIERYEEAWKILKGHV